MSKLSVLLILFFITGTVAAQPKTIIVVKDGSGQYSTVQAAIDAIPAGNTQTVTIKVKKGIYREVVTIAAGKNHISLSGEGKDNTIISFNNHTGTVLPNGDTVNTPTSASVFVFADDFHADHISFQNDAGFTAGQAVALRVHGDRASFTDCAMTGFQDVLYLSGSKVRHFFDNCYIEGTTDFIFGAATAIFRNCHIHSKKNSHVTAASTPADVPYGFVFFNCRLTADTNVNKVSLGRPWRPASSVTYINCSMDAHIIPEGWNNWKNPANEATARYAEYRSTGAGASPATRVPWSKQLNEEEVKQYSFKNILGNWDPLSKQ